MKTTKLVFMVMIGLAMIEFTAGQSFNIAAAASVKTAKTSLASSKTKAKSTATAAKSKKLMKGVATVYADKFIGRKTASGQRFRQSELTAAHRLLPLGTKVRVTNLRNQKTVEVRINDRGPWAKGRIIDLSAAAPAKVGMAKRGTALVKLEVVSSASSG